MKLLTPPGPAVLSIFLASACAGAARAAAPPPNVLFIGVDDLRCNIGVYGDPVARTPNIDRLAKMGTVFLRAYVQQAVCSASRASMLTGCRPDTTTVDYPYNPYFVDKFLPAHPSLPVHFSRQGYNVLAGGKIHHAFTYDLKELGFQGNYWYRDWHYGPGGNRVVLEDVMKAAALKDKTMALASDYVEAASQARETARDKKNPPPAFECAEAEDTDYRDGRLAAVAAAAVRGHKPDSGPFFIAAGFYKPHLPFNAPKKYWDLYDRNAFVLPAANRLLTDPALAGLANASYEMAAFEGGQIDLKDDARLRLMTHGYYACTSFTDANIGKLLDALEASGAMARTVIVLWSDHGFHLGENQSFGKHTVFEMATRSPLIIAAPGMAPGQVCEALVEYVDIFPTLCDLTGTAKPDYLAGTSLVPLLRDPKAPWKNSAFSQWPRNKDVEGYSVRTARHRYTEWRRVGGGVQARELYDHSTDPGESTNLAAQDHETARELAALLAKQWPDKPNPE